MTDPIKLQIQKAIVDEIKAITPVNGYVSDLADFDPGDGVTTSRVYRGRAFFGDGDPVPMVSILEATNGEDVINEMVASTPVSEYWWGLLIQGWVEDSKSNPTDPVYPLLADVRKCFAKQMKRTQGQFERRIFGFGEDVITGIRFGGGLVRPANELSAYAGFHMMLELCIVDKADG
jgi:hypothetical protein